MLMEDSAYANRWRRVSPGAKGLVALAGFVAALAAKTPEAAAVVTAALVTVTLAGARIPLGRYLRVAAPALLFLALGSLSLAFSLASTDVAGIHLEPASIGMRPLAQLCGRSLASLASLLFLGLTTPLVDLLALLRRLRTPEVLMGLMVIGYRMSFVLSEALGDTLTAQAARLGASSRRRALRSLGDLVASLTVQVWQRSLALHIAAQARNDDGPLRFLEPTFANARRDKVLAAIGGVALIRLTVELT